MNCARAQEILSEAVDREHVSPQLLEEARSHCRDCPECSRFVRGLALIERAEAPVPPARLHDRVMAAVAAERAAGRGAAATAGRDVAASDDRGVLPMPAAAPAAEATRPDGARQRWRRDPWKTAAWFGAAAVVLVALGIAGMAGIRGLESPIGTSLRAAAPEQENSADKAASGSTTAGSGYEATGTQDTASPAATAATPGVVPDYIVVDNVVYRSSGTAALQRSQLEMAGTTFTSLDSGSAPQSLTVFATPTAGRVVILFNGQTLAFDAVTRTLDGRRYSLASGPIERFGVWPSLPSGFTQPVTSEGAPSFVAGPTDDAGVEVYTRPGVAIDRGFAIAPGTAPTDPAQANPNWTWWRAAAP